MKIKSFNDIVKSLEGGRSTNKSEEVEELAHKLHEQGITTSLLEAKEKAKSMISTEDTIIKDTDKKEKATTYNDPRSNPQYNQYKAAMIEEMRKRAVEGREAINIQDEFQTPSYEQRNPNQVHSQAAVNMRQAPKVSAVAAQPVEQARPAPSVQAPIETVREEQSSPEPVQEAPAKPAVNLETYEEPEEPAQEKKQNPKVDLASVFSFGKK